MLIFSCVCHFPGSVHDARILRRSNLFRAFEHQPPVDGHLLGDNGYNMLRPWLLTPYINPPANSPQQRFNDAHSAARCTIERCNVVLKLRWACLHFELRYQPVRVVQIIKAYIVLHNMAVRNRVPEPDPDDFEDDNPCNDNIDRND